MKILIVCVIAGAIVAIWWAFLRVPRPEISSLEIDESDPLYRILLLWLKKWFGTR